ncbi:MAG: aconitate hydratase, partial [Nitrospinota bacterium]
EAPGGTGETGRGTACGPFNNVERHKMRMNLVQKVIRAHLVEGRAVAGEEVAIRIDQVLTQDATGTAAYLQFEAMGLPRVKVETAVSYVDHNMLQTGFENADDHRYLRSAAARYGAYFSNPGNGICHQAHLERFSAPGKTLLGSDSHTPTCGGAGMLAIGAGGLDVAVALGGGPFYFKMPKVLNVHLKGRLRAWVAAKDIILELLRRLTVKGGVGWILEYGGPGVRSLTVPERATITNMGAELGATTSIFPSDGRTREYLRAQGRARQWRPVEADRGAEYEERIELDLSELEPMVACPSSPDNVQPVRRVAGHGGSPQRRLAGTPVAQVCVGSCTNSSYQDLMVIARTLRGKRIASGLSMTVTPGSKQVFEMIARDGGLADLIGAGARILESACGPCIGMGQAPPSGGASLRTFNRNFKGRSGTPDDAVYLASPEVAAATALKGVITDPRDLGRRPRVRAPERFLINDNMIVPPTRGGKKVEVIRGPNIREIPLRGPLEDPLRGEVLLKVGDNITTDHIMPAGARILPLRSNIPAIAEHVFEPIDPEFPARAKAAGGGFIVGGENYGQGSSREHAALAPMFLGLRGVIAKSFARIHWANLVNFGILPLQFIDPLDYDRIEPGDVLEIKDVLRRLEAGEPLTVLLKSKGRKIPVACELTERQRSVLLAGGLLNHTRMRHPRGESRNGGGRRGRKGGKGEKGPRKTARR